MSRTVPAAVSATLLGVGLVILAPLSPAAADPPAICSRGTCAVSYVGTGAPETFTVPVGVSTLTVTAAGAQGGSVVADSGYLYAAGGGGGLSTGTITVVPGAVLTLVVGQPGGSTEPNAPVPDTAGGPGGYGGGGDGGDDVRTQMGGMPGGGGGSFVFGADGAMLLAAGGGGGASIHAVGGAGAGAGVPAAAGTDGSTGATGGQPGTEPVNGDGGAAGDGDGAGPGAPGTGEVASPSTLPVGGKGGPGYQPGGGGGGGFHAGGGGGGVAIVGPEAGGAGGGGAGYAAPGVSEVSASVGSTSGGGAVTLSWALPAPDVSFSASPTSSTYGDPVVLTATVTGSGSTPTGSVDFLAGATLLCSGPLSDSGGANRATCTTGTIGAGVDSLTASYQGSDTHGPATSAATSVTVLKAAQSLSFTSSPPRPAKPRTTYQAAAVGQRSDTAATYSVAPSSRTVCSVSAAGRVRFTTSGACAIRAQQPGTSNYEASPTVTQSVTVSRLSQRITFRKPGPLAVGRSSTLRASSSSGNKVTFRSLTARTCSVRGNKVTARKVGGCTVVAATKRSSTYAGAEKKQTFKVGRR